METPQNNIDFPTALRKMIDGKKITKLEWKNPKLYGMIYGGFLKLHNPDGTFNAWILSTGDLYGDDFIVVK